MSTIDADLERPLLRDHRRELSRAASLATTGSDESDLRNPRISESSLNYSRLGYKFTHDQILLATGNFRKRKLIKRGSSGDFFHGDFRQAWRIIAGSTESLPQFPHGIVVKRIDLKVITNRAAYLWELDFLSKVGQAKHFSPLGHCLKEKDEKFLVYKYMPNRDLSSSLFRKDSGDGGLTSLDWITRLKIASGAAAALAFLHHECNPPLVHGDVQASSILLDDNFAVRLGSLSSSQEIHKPDAEDHWIIRALRNYDKCVFRARKDPEKDTWGMAEQICAHDVYCFGKVLLELVTGRLGISTPSNIVITDDWLEETLLKYISLFDKELITNIMDPSLVIDEDLLEEVWCMGLVARCCLERKPTRRPQMVDVLKALENPLELLMVTTEQARSSVVLPSNGSWTDALLGDWRRSVAKPQTV